MEHNIEQIIHSLEEQFNGDSKHDVQILRDYCRSLERSDESLAIITAIGRYAAEHFPDEDIVREAKKFEETFGHFMDLTQHAQQCMKEKKFEEALKDFQEIIGDVRPPEDEEKRHCSFFHPFEEMIFRSNNPDIKEIERISTLPQVVYMQMGSALFELKRYDEAREAYINAQKLSPVSPAIHFELAQIAKIQNDLDTVRDILKNVYPYLYTRSQLARFYREHAGLAMIDEKYDLAAALIYLSIDYEDSGIARAQLNSLAKHRGVDLSKPKVDTVKARLGEANIPVGPAPQVYELAMYIGKQMKRPYPQVARMAFTIAYELTHFEPLLREIESLPA